VVAQDDAVAFKNDSILTIDGLEYTVRDNDDCRSAQRTTPEQMCDYWIDNGCLAPRVEEATAVSRSIEGAENGPSKNTTTGGTVILTSNRDDDNSGNEKECFISCNDWIKFGVPALAAIAIMCLLVALIVCEKRRRRRRKGTASPLDDRSSKQNSVSQRLHFDLEEAGNGGGVMMLNTGIMMNGHHHHEDFSVTPQCSDSVMAKDQMLLSTPISLVRHRSLSSGPVDLDDIVENTNDDDDDYYDVEALPAAAYGQQRTQPRDDDTAITDATPKMSNRNAGPRGRGGGRRQQPRPPPPPPRGRDNNNGNDTMTAIIIPPIMLKEIAVLSSSSPLEGDDDHSQLTTIPHPQPSKKVL
jgi:hypothetical protein